MESKEQEDGPYMAPIKAGKYEYRPETLVVQHPSNEG